MVPRTHRAHNVQMIRRLELFVLVRIVLFLCFCSIVCIYISIIYVYRKRTSFCIDERRRGTRPDFFWMHICQDFLDVRPSVICIREVHFSCFHGMSWAGQ